MRTQLPSILLLLAVLSAFAVQSHATMGYPESGWTRIKKADDYYHALDIARFALAQHYRETEDKLEFVRLFRGYVAGKFYRLYFKAKNDNGAQKYEVVVFEKVPNKVRELLHFRITS